MQSQLSGVFIWRRKILFRSNCSFHTSGIGPLKKCIELWYWVPKSEIIGGGMLNIRQSSWRSQKMFPTVCILLLRPTCLATAGLYISCTNVNFWSRSQNDDIKLNLLYVTALMEYFKGNIKEATRLTTSAIEIDRRNQKLNEFHYVSCIIAVKNAKWLLIPVKNWVSYKTSFTTK